ncbi:hypothetical protein N7468_006553 [Penicillium chermesinum]|uniref:Uncharacterized protein n=1 Tax=Penicillium chermesinum TaxID=63820 RepID=A0A9W9NSV4_9EURO|nr:uncharacterized protein N7468_006553 [Penicillium chermesinum]KAJ5225328.1 hypothetical protein N7468_006553 [Penicillium chermesinum]KAJ6161445.1 hypothetical protein N7470_004841 [Penicillium chermesinum]
MTALRAGRAACLQVRGFATTPGLRVGPESPNFIDVPKTYQTRTPVKPSVKGTLPVPREVFPPRRADKPSKKYLDDVAREPLTKKEGTVSEKQAFKIEMAGRRRHHLRKGLNQLYERKRKTDNAMFQQSLESQLRRERILRQPEPEDERLTRSSVVEDMQPLKHSTLPDPNREQRLALSQARLEASLAQKNAQRQEDIQELYMNARSFITTEEQLSAEIDRVFPVGENEAWRNDHQEGANIWNLGQPPTVTALVNETRKSETTRWDVTQERLKRLGEQITGGKM